MKRRACLQVLATGLTFACLGGVSACTAGRSRSPSGGPAKPQPSQASAPTYRVTKYFFAPLSATEDSAAASRLGDTLQLFDSKLLYRATTCNLSTTRTENAEDYLSEYHMEPSALGITEKVLRIITTDCANEVAELIADDDHLFFFWDGVFYKLERI